MRSESKPSKPPPSDTKLSEDATDGGCRHLRPEAWDVPPASADATAVAASAAAVTGEEGRAAGAVADGNVRSTIVWSGASMEAAAWSRLVASARRQRCLLVALAAVCTVGGGAPVTNSPAEPGAPSQAAAAAEVFSAAITADVGVYAAPAATAAEPGATKEAAVAAECVAAAVAARRRVDVAAAASAAERGPAKEAASAAECVAAAAAARPGVEAAAAASAAEPGAAKGAAAAAGKVADAVAARPRVGAAAAASADDVGAAAGGVTLDGASPTIMTSSSAATPPVAETSTASPKGGVAVTVLGLEPLVAPSAATDASAAALDDDTLMPSAASILLAWCAQNAALMGVSRMNGRLNFIMLVRCVVASPNFSTALATQPIVRSSAMPSACARLAALVPMGWPAHELCSSSLSLSTSSAGAAPWSAFPAAAAAFAAAAGVGYPSAAACSADGPSPPASAAAAALAAAQACVAAVRFCRAAKSAAADLNRSWFFSFSQYWAHGHVTCFVRRLVFFPLAMSLAWSPQMRPYTFVPQYRPSAQLTRSACVAMSVGLDSLACTIQLETSMTPATIFAHCSRSASMPRLSRIPLTPASFSLRSMWSQSLSTRTQNSLPDWSVPRIGLLASISYASMSAMFSTTAHAGPRPIVSDGGAAGVADRLGGATTTARRRRWKGGSAAAAAQPFMRRPIDGSGSRSRAGVGRRHNRLLHVSSRKVGHGGRGLVRAHRQPSCGSLGVIGRALGRSGDRRRRPVRGSSELRRGCGRGGRSGFPGRCGNGSCCCVGERGMAVRHQSLGNTRPHGPPLPLGPLGPLLAGRPIAK